MFPGPPIPPPVFQHAYFFPPNMPVLPYGAPPGTRPVPAGIAARTFPGRLFAPVPPPIGAFPMPLSAIIPNDDLGVGDGYLSQLEITDDLRYKFLDKWIYKIPKIMQRLKISGGNVEVLSKKAAASNDDDDNDKDLMKKSDFVAHDILTKRKAKKILWKLAKFNRVRFFDLPYNEEFVKKAFKRYVVNKLDNFVKSSKEESND